MIECYGLRLRVDQESGVLVRMQDLLEQYFISTQLIFEVLLK
jgi:hypothetical protein